jgi:hypothetical protein
MWCNHHARTFRDRAQRSSQSVAKSAYASPVRFRPQLSAHQSRSRPPITACRIATLHGPKELLARHSTMCLIALESQAMTLGARS